MATSGVYRYPHMDQVVFGKPCAEAMAEETARIGANKVFIVASGTLNRTSDVVGNVVAKLGNRHAGTWDRIAAHTPRTDCVAAANAARDAGADLIATVGGGSVTDAGKMIQLCLANDVTKPEQLDDYKRVTNATPPTRKPVKPPVVRQIAVPTTLSAGEFNAGAGCTDTATKKKESYFHALHVPRVVILDPAATVHTPLWLFLSSGIRAVDHAAEDICSPRCNAYSEASDIHALKLLGRGLRGVKANESDMAARLDCLMGMWLSVVGSQAGVDKGASHAIGHILGGTAGVPHGYTSCVMLPYVMRWNKSVNAERQAVISEALGRPGGDAGDALHELISALGLPRTLKEVGVGPDQFDLLAENTMHDRWTYTNPRKINGAGDIKSILEMAA